MRVTRCHTISQERPGAQHTQKGVAWASTQAKTRHQRAAKRCDSDGSTGGEYEMNALPNAMATIKRLHMLTNVR